MTPSMIIVGIVVAVILFETIVLFPITSLWFRAMTSGCKIPFMRILAMRVRRVNANIVVDAFIQANHAKVVLTLDDLEAHYLAGGNPGAVVGLMIKAKNRDLTLPYELAAKTDLAGFDLETVNPEELSNVINQSTP